MKKAQIQGQIFIYILTVIIAGFIFTFGYNAIVGFTGQIQTSKMIDFEINLKNTINKISTEYQSLEKKKFVLPKDYTKVCFIDYSKEYFDLETNYWHTGEPSNFDNDYPLLADAITSGVKDNVFIYSTWLEKSFSIGEIDINNGTADVAFECIEVFNGNLFLEIRGLGNRAQIKEDKSEES